MRSHPGAAESTTPSRASLSLADRSRKGTGPRLPSLHRHWTAAAAYAGGVVAVNVGFSHTPDLDWFWSVLVGSVLALRDGTQRQWGHGVLGLMLVGESLS